MARQSAFAGKHTIRKLEAIDKYLRAFQTVMKKQRFSTVFFDAFAGTGDLPSVSPPASMFGEDSDGLNFIEGSARRALRVVPSFDRYVFVEQKKGKVEELLKLKTEFSELRSRISIFQEDANAAITKFCARTNWTTTRAVLFLDPFGNQVSFSTLEAVAQCNIDLWYLFPAGIGVNRQISADGAVVASAEQSLDRLYGTPNWRNVLIRHRSIPTLFGDVALSEKESTADAATRFMIERMKPIFHGHVLDRWLPLGRGGGHWYSLIFAYGNPNQRAWEIGSRIAEAVTKRK
jgi:three-Cys-motif partner protein